MQAMVLQYPVRFSFLDTPLGTFCTTFSTANAFFGNVITLFCYCTTTQCISVPENRVHTEIKIFHLRPVDAENDADTSCITGIDIGQIRLFLENNIALADIRIISLYFV